jgi:hypothetical protein
MSVFVVDDTESDARRKTSQWGVRPPAEDLAAPSHIRILPRCSKLHRRRLPGQLQFSVRRRMARPEM